MDRNQVLPWMEINHVVHHTQAMTAVSSSDVNSPLDLLCTYTCKSRENSLPVLNVRCSELLMPLATIAGVTVYM